jgi:hypothetical protein
MKRCFADDSESHTNTEQESKRLRMDECGGYVGVWIKIYQKIKTRFHAAPRA